LFWKEREEAAQTFGVFLGHFAGAISGISSNDNLPRLTDQLSTPSYVAK
jgi:hypothetical protein